jgi:drug/metabolite transporter (DMT)-like permease
MQRRRFVNMKPITWVGILLIVLGIFVFAYQGINYTHKKPILDVGSVHIATETHERLPLSPILGGLALAGGVVFVVVGARNKS